MTIAASDPSGGAGIQADILTLASMGCHPVSVLTAVTIQDSVGVEDILPLDAEWVVDQGSLHPGGYAGSRLQDRPARQPWRSPRGSLKCCRLSGHPAGVRSSSRFRTWR